MDNNKPLFMVLAKTVQARLSCIASDNQEWKMRHEEKIANLVANHMPHGSGFDNGTHLDLTHSTGDKLVFTTAFHHMNDNGFYTKWTDHTVTVLPSLYLGFTVKVSGENYRDIKDYIAETFDSDLSCIRNVD